MVSGGDKFNRASDNRQLILLSFIAVCWVHCHEGFGFYVYVNFDIHEGSCDAIMTLASLLNHTICGVSDILVHPNCTWKLITMNIFGYPISKSDWNLKCNSKHIEEYRYWFAHESCQRSLKFAWIDFARQLFSNE